MVRTIVVVALAALVVGLTVPNIWAPAGNNLPIGVSASYDVIAIAPGSVAEAAGLRVGDHIDPQSTSLMGRLNLGGYSNQLIGEARHFSVIRGGRRIAITIPGPPSQRFSGLAIVKRTTASMFVIVAAALLLLRPSAMLWGFFLYAIGSVEGSPLILEAINPGLYIPISMLFFMVGYGIVGPLGLLVFATRFPVPPSAGLRRLISTAIPWLAILLCIPAVSDWFFIAGVPQPSMFDIIDTGIPAVVLGTGVVALVAGFAQLDAPQRQRLRWVVAGFALYYLAVVYMQTSGFLPGNGWPAAWINSGWSSDVLNGFVVFIPITVAYAVLKHHVLDVNFVIGRGLVYAILTSIAVATFAIVDWLLGTVLAQTKLATVGEVIAAIAIGFWLNGMHGQVDRFVDSVIFRRRHLAEKRLAQVAAGLPHAKSYTAVTTLLVREPVDALGLLSAAFFRRSDDGGYRCEMASHLAEAETTRIGPDDVLAVHLHGARGPVFLHQIDWPMPLTVSDPRRRPVVALPIFVRHDLDGIVFYGGHETGEAIDPDELKALESLCVGAAAALDHLDAAELRRRLDEMERALDIAQSESIRLRSAMAQ